MRALVTGSAGHLGEALVRTLRERGDQVEGLDLLASPFTTRIGSINDRNLLTEAMRGVDVVFHAATLHKPHVATHSLAAFVETNVAGTLAVLETAVAERIAGVVFTSTTSAFGAALRPAEGEPAAWIDEDVPPVPRNIYGVTKTAAEDLCELFHRTRGLACIVLRTSRFFPEEDDDDAQRDRYDSVNLKVNEYLYRRVDLADAVAVHLLAAERLPGVGFARYVVSATTPFSRDQAAALRHELPSLVRSLFPDFEDEYRRRGWSMLPGIDRVYDNRRAREQLGWKPRFDFRHALDLLGANREPFSELALEVGSKGYHR